MMFIYVVLIQSPWTRVSQDAAYGLQAVKRRMSQTNTHKHQYNETENESVQRRLTEADECERSKQTQHDDNLPPLDHQSQQEEPHCSFGCCCCPRYPKLRDGAEE